MSEGRETRMRAWIKKIMAPPIFEGDEDKTRTASLLNIFFWTLFLLAILSAVLTVFVNIFTNQSLFHDVVHSLLFVLLAVIGLFLEHRGRVSFASMLLICLLGVALVPVVVERGGVTAPSFSAYFLLVVMASLLLWRGAVLWVAGISILLGLVLFILQSASVLVMPIAPSPFDAWVAYSLIFVFSAIMLHRESLSVQRAFANQREANLELREVQASLERRVEDRTRALVQRARYLEAITTVAQDVASVLDVQDLLTRVASLISEQFGFYHVGIFLLDGTGEWAVLRAASSEGGQRMLARGHRLEVGQTGTVGYVTARGEPRIALDVGVDAVFFDNPDLPETRSAMTLPLRARGRILGALDVQSRQSGAFTDEDATILQGLADQVALAISNAQLFEQLQESVAAERMAYGELSRRAWAEMLQARADMGYVAVQDGLYPASGTPPIALQALSKEDHLVLDEEGTLALPVKVREGDSMLGVVRLRKPEGATWTEEQIAMMQAIAEQTGVALERARLYQDSRRLAMRERIVGEATARMRQSLDIEDVLKAAADEIYQALELDEVFVRLKTEADTEVPNSEVQE